MDKKGLWYWWEKITAELYTSKWWIIERMNYTIKWWEIDIVAVKWQIYKFIEVKTVNFVDDIYNFITAGKKAALRRAINKYLVDMNLDVYDTDASVDFIFIKNGKVREVFENQEI